MISPGRGVAFTEAADGDMLDPASVEVVADSLGISSMWAVVSQVHGKVVRRADQAGSHGDGDAIITERPGLPVAVRTADCLGVVGLTAGRVGAAHAGWRGLATGVLEEFAEAMGDAARFYVGPSIGPCCYEVGPEVAGQFTSHLARTTHGTVSVDLRSAAREALGGVEWMDDRCTQCHGGLLSHRQDTTRRRMAAIGWL